MWILKTGYSNVVYIRQVKFRSPSWPLVKTPMDVLTKSLYEVYYHTVRYTACLTFTLHVTISLLV
jgi:hypothetical protein